MTILAKSPNSPQTAPVKISQCVPDTLSGWKAGSILNDQVYNHLMWMLKSHRRFPYMKRMTQSEFETYQIHMGAMRHKGSGASCVASINNRRKDLENVLQHKNPGQFRKDSRNLCKKGYLHAESSVKFLEDGKGSGPTIYIPKNQYGVTLNWDREPIRKIVLIKAELKKQRGPKPRKNPVGRPRKDAVIKGKSSTVRSPKKLSTSAPNSDTIYLRYRYEKACLPPVESPPIPRAELSKRFDISAIFSKNILAPTPKSPMRAKATFEGEKRKKAKPVVELPYNPYDTRTPEQMKKALDKLQKETEEQLESESADQVRMTERTTFFAEKMSSKTILARRPVDAVYPLEKINGIEALGISYEDLKKERLRFEAQKFSSARIQANAILAAERLTKLRKKGTLKSAIAYLIKCVINDFAEFDFECNRLARANR